MWGNTVQSAIELYEKAYNLDYNKGDQKAAEKVYQQIIEMYPGSDEREYAQVHLERINQMRANPKLKKFNVNSKNSAGKGLVIFSYLLIVILFAGLVFLFTQLQQTQNENKTNYNTIKGLLSQKNGDTELAQRYLKIGLKYASNSSKKQQAMVHHALAELYLSSYEYENAHRELTKWKKLDSRDQSLISFQNRLESAEEQGVINDQ